MDAAGGPPPNLPNIMILTVAQLQQRYWRLLDIAVPHILYRWLGFAGLFLVYMLRVWMLQGWYIVTYGLGIHILNLFIGFITPQADPDAEGPTLPRYGGDDSKPGFSPKVSEFKFWEAAIRGTATAFLMTFFTMFDVVVYWPILVMYFLLLLVLTLRDRIAHMVKHKYIPCSCTKKKYGKGGKGEGGGGKGGGEPAFRNK